MRFSTIQHVFFFGLLATITVAFIWLVRDFLLPVFWAIVLAILFYPLQKWWLRKITKRSSIASLYTLLSVTTLIIVPLFIVGSLVVSESINYYQAFTAEQGVNENSISILDRAIQISADLEPFGIEQEKVAIYVTEGANVATSWLVEQALSFGQNVFKIALLFFLMLYVLFFILRDGPKLEKRLFKVLPLGDRRERRLVERFVSTTRATMKGTFVIAVVQGAIGGILFWIAGISAPALWGTVMAFASIIPALGPSLVWFPAGIILLVSGNVWQGAVVLAGGLIVISLIDNLIRPPLVGRDTEMPDILILLSTLGGLTLFGITGFVIGPIIAAFFLAMWQMFEEEFETELELHG